MMDDLRHGMGEEPVEEESPVEPEATEPEPTEHAHPPVFDRLSAYGQRAVPTYGQHEALDDAASADSDTGTDADAPDEEPHGSVEAFAEEETEQDDAVEHEPEQDDAAEHEHEPEPEPVAQTIARPPSETERMRRRLAVRRGRGADSGTKPAKDKRAKKLVGLKIGASQIAAARVVNNGAPVLLEVVREPLDPGVVVAGEIRDPEALAGALKRFFELHKLPKKGVRLGLSNNRIGVRVFQIEGVSDERQLENAIRFRAEEVLPIPLDQAVLDYVVLDESALEDGTPVKRILLVVAYRDVVERYLQACRGAGLEVVGIDLEAFALLRSLAEPSDPAPGGGALIAVAIGHDRTTIAVSTGRFCEFTRVLDWGGWSLNVAIARELTVAPSEVEHIKRQLSLSDTAPLEDVTPEQAVKIREAVERALTAFARELVASLHFYQAQPGALGIGEVVLTGGTTHMPGLPEAVGRLIGVPVRVGDPFKRVKVGPNVGHEDQHGSLAVAIGLGIED
jgi:type IV pilus assembly protein PilM